MNNLGSALKEAITNLTTCPSDDHICPHCEKVVPKLTLNLLGMQKTVQPRCKCEVEHYESSVSESTELKQKNEIERKFSISKLGERFEQSTFESFGQRIGTEKAYQLSKDYADTFPMYGVESLMIWGNPGNGKSHLAAAVCHEIKSKGYIPVFQSVPELLERIKNTFNRNAKESEKEVMDALRECDLLVLDDIGAEKITDWVLEVLFRIIDGRYRKLKPTLFTTNFSPQALLDRFMPAHPSAEQETTAKRIHDRIIEVSTIIENKADSYRMQVAKQRAQTKRGWSE